MMGVMEENEEEGEVAIEAEGSKFRVGWVT